MSIFSKICTASVELFWEFFAQGSAGWMEFIILSRITSLYTWLENDLTQSNLLYSRTGIAAYKSEWLLNANGERKHVFRSAFHYDIICFGSRSICFPTRASRAWNTQQHTRYSLWEWRYCRSNIGPEQEREGRKQTVMFDDVFSAWPAHSRGKNCCPSQLLAYRKKGVHLVQQFHHQEMQPGSNDPVDLPVRESNQWNGWWSSQVADMSWKKMGEFNSHI